jgi:hypothetical protein
VTAYLLYALGTIFLAIGVIGYIMEPRMLMSNAMAAVCGFALILFGVSFHRLARKG